MSHQKSAFHLIGRLAMPLGIIGLGIVGFMILGKGEQETRPETDPSGPPAVRVASVAEHSDTLNLRVDGIVVPYREIELAAEVAGVVAKKSPDCEAGEYVMKDTPLIEIDPRDYQLEVRRLESMVQQADADLGELDQDIANTRELLELADKDLTLQSREFDRLKMLVGRGVVTESEVDRAEQSVLTSRNAKVTRENQLSLLAKRRVRLESAKQLAESELEKATLDVERTTISAPVDGVIVRESVEAGSFVQRGTPLATIEDTSRVEVRCNLEMDELYWIWDQPGVSRPTNLPGFARGYQLPPTPATVEYRMAGREDVIYRWDGTLSRFDGIGLDEQTRTVPVRVVVDDPRAVQALNTRTNQIMQVNSGPQALMRGMFVTVVIHSQPSSRIVQIPEAALRPGEQIFRVRDGQLHVLSHVRVVKRQMNNVHRDERGMWLVQADESQLSDQDFVVVGPLAHVKDGMAVTPTFVEPSAPTSTATAEPSDTSRLPPETES